jgi:pimeloyl-ACP methyl ester carboxylesterase
MKLPILYLHGFASSPQSHKATFLSARWRAEGRTVVIPDLNCGDFSTLTITKMLHAAEAEASALGGPYALVGSSMGGYAAALLAARRDRYLKGMILMAPAFQPDTLWQRELNPAEMAAWRASGVLMVDHHAYGKKVPISVRFLEDAARHDPYPDIGDVPCAIIHGTQDTVVPVTLSEQFSGGRPNVALHPVADDHELKSSLVTIARIAGDLFAKLEA